jgi:hypothetical protein
MTSRRTADRVVELLGGRVQQDLTSGLVEVLTTSPTVDILLTGPAALRVHWQHAGSHCDGVTQGDGRPCACSPSLAQRRAAGKQGRGCRPCAELRFRLTSRPRLGTFSFACEDWSFVELVARTQAALRGRQPGEPARGTAWPGAEPPHTPQRHRPAIYLPRDHPPWRPRSGFDGPRCRGGQHLSEGLRRPAPWRCARSGAWEAPGVAASAGLVPHRERGGAAVQGRSGPGARRHRLPGWPACR